MEKHTVLITGGNGKIGRCVAEKLREQGYIVRSTSRTPDPASDVTELNVSDADACVEAMRGVDTVIHLAFYMRSDKFREEHAPNNILGAWNIYEAAVKNGVKRVIFGSSNHAVGFFKREDRILPDMYRPDSVYGLSKCFTELCGRFFSDRHGISVINMRIGTFPHKGGLPRSYRQTRTWLSYRDCQQLFLRCVEADESIKFLTIFGISGNSGTDYDVSGLKELIGYEPQDDGYEHLAYALENDFLHGADDNGFLGAVNVCYDYLGKLRGEDIGELNRRHNINPDYKNSFEEEKGL